MKPDYLLIPKIVYDNENLTPADWVVYSICYWYQKMVHGKCIASNRAIADVANLKSRAVRAALERLELEGYIKRVFRDNKRKIRSEIKVLIAFSKVGMDEPTLGMVVPTRVGMVVPQNSNIHKEKDNNNLAPSGAGQEIAEMIYLFKEVNPAIEKYYGNKTQRSAVERLLKSHGRENLGAMIKALSKVNAIPYWPKSTTPLQLEDNLGKYKALNESEKNKKSQSKIKVAIIT